MEGWKDGTHENLSRFFVTAKHWPTIAQSQKSTLNRVPLFFRPCNKDPHVTHIAPLIAMEPMVPMAPMGRLLGRFPPFRFPAAGAWTLGQPFMANRYRYRCKRGCVERPLRNPLRTSHIYSLIPMVTIVPMVPTVPMAPTIGYLGDHWPLGDHWHLALG